MNTETDSLKDKFAEVHNLPPSGLVRAPGRVNLIGEHTDYNDGFVLPIAIEKQTLAAFAPRADSKVSFTSLQAEGSAEIDLTGQIVPGEPAWANYCRGVAAGLIRRGVRLAGADILFASNVPLGGGLSSSASLEVATALALLAAAGKSGELSDRELALTCQEAEHEFAGAPCGIMDQSVVLMARPGRALLLDCRSGATQQVRFDEPGVVVLVADTQVTHDIADGGYAARRKQCYAAAEKLDVKMLRDADEATVTAAAANGALVGKELMRARHVVTENARTRAGCEALTAGDYDRFGELMYASHASLRDDYEVSCEELDAIVELAGGCDGVYGSRMTGGGFGGCAIILAEADKAETIIETVREGFAERFGRRCPIFATAAAAGAEVVE